MLLIKVCYVTLCYGQNSPGEKMREQCELLKRRTRWTATSGIT